MHHGILQILSPCLWALLAGLLIARTCAAGELDVNFRAFPKTDNYEDALFAEGTVCAAPGDVFPEQMATFVTPQPEIRQLLFSQHPELLDATYWQRKQHNIRAGVVEDIFPYPDSNRFYHQYTEDSR